METATQTAMPRAKYEKLAAFRRLTQKQKAWVIAFLESQDAAHSTEVAYGVANSPYASMLCRKIEASPNVVEFLDAALQRTPKQSLLCHLENVIRCSSGIAKVQALQLFAKVSGLDSETPEPEQPACKVGDAKITPISSSEPVAEDMGSDFSEAELSYLDRDDVRGYAVAAAELTGNFDRIRAWEKLRGRKA